MSSVLKPTLALLALMLACGSTPAFADEPASRTVSLEGLVLTDPHDAAIAYRRIRIAALRVCRDEHQFGATSLNAMGQCVHMTVSNAVANLNVSELSSLHSNRSGATNLANAQPRSAY